MIISHRTAICQPGKTVDAIAWAKEICALVKTHKIEVTLFSEIGGNPLALVWHAQYESLAALESAGKKLVVDPDYQKLLAKAAGLLVPNTIHDTIWSSIP
jgi:hypothetical protein